jgi:hypothetical protein
MEQMRKHTLTIVAIRLITDFFLGRTGEWGEGCIEGFEIFHFMLIRAPKKRSNFKKLEVSS